MKPCASCGRPAVAVLERRLPEVIPPFGSEGAWAPIASACGREGCLDGLLAHLTRLGPRGARA